MRVIIDAADGDGSGVVFGGGAFGSNSNDIPFEVWYSTIIDKKFSKADRPARCSYAFSCNPFPVHCHHLLPTSDSSVYYLFSRHQ